MILYYYPSCDDCITPATDDRGRDVLRVTRGRATLRQLDCGDYVRASAPPASVRERLTALGLALDDAGVGDNDDA